VVLAAGCAQALEDAAERLAVHGGHDPLAHLRDALLARLLALPGVLLSGPDPHRGGQRLPHHISVLVNSPGGEPLAGRDLVRLLWRHGLAVSSGSACSALSTAAGQGGSAVLRAMGYGEAEAASGLRISLGPWVRPEDLVAVPEQLDQVRRQLGSDRTGR
jgi:cysteine desulfurase